MSAADGYDTTGAAATAATTTPDRRRAKTGGLVVAGLGIVVFNIAPFLDWVTNDVTGGNDDTATGYNTDSLVPFMAYLGIGLLLAMLYAVKRARRGQHRGLTLVSMAVAIAATLQCIAFAVEPMGGLERGYGLVPELGVYVGIIGAALWAIGSGMLAKEIEGDDEHEDFRATARTR